jgi:hypothetical protein
MNRRDFLKWAATGSLAVLAAQFTRKLSFVFPGVDLPGDFAARLGGKLFRGTSDGRVLASTDGGRAWHCSAYFGGQSRVQDLYVSGGRLFAEIGIPGGTFELASADGIVWRTIG